MKRSIKIRVICFAVAAIVLTGAITVAAVQGSPYEVLKDGVWNWLTEANDNYTIASTMTMKVGGVVEESETTRSIYTKDGNVDYYFDGNGNPERFYFSSENLNIGSSNVYTSADGQEWYSASIYRRSGNYLDDAYGGYDLDRSSASMRFGELLLDLMVGDMKNNLTMTSNGGVRTISGVYTESQIPEIVKAGIDMIVDESRGYNRNPELTRADFPGRKTWEMPIKAVTLNKVSGQADVNNDGIMTGMAVYASVTMENIFGDINEMEIDAAVAITDIGTSVLECPILGAAELLTPEFAKDMFGSDSYYTQVYFTLNSDGSINAGSVTTAHPGEKTRSSDRSLDTDYTIS